MSTDCQIGINSPVSQASTVKGPHVDNRVELYAGLFYMRTDEDDSRGGSLEIFRPKDPNMKIVHKTTLGHKHQHYENMVDRAHHDHLVCLKCDKVVEFLEPQIEELQEKVCIDHGFEIKDHSLQLFGICSDCKEADAEANN